VLNELNPLARISYYEYSDESPTLGAPLSVVPIAGALNTGTPDSGTGGFDSPETTEVKPRWNMFKIKVLPGEPGAAESGFFLAEKLP
jgi:hypothetical protein